MGGFGAGLSAGAFEPFQAPGGFCAPLQHLVFATVRAGDVVAAAVAGEVFGLDQGLPLDGAGTGDEQLAAGEVAHALFEQAQGRAFVINVCGPFIDFIGHGKADGLGGQGGGAVGSAEKEGEAALNRPAAPAGGFVAAAADGDKAIQGGGLDDGGQKTLLAVVLRVLQGGLHHHHVLRIGVEQER